MNSVSIVSGTLETMKNQALEEKARNGHRVDCPKGELLTTNQ